MYQKPETVEVIVMASCVLHNLLFTRYPLQEQANLDREDPIQHTFEPGLWREERQLTNIVITGRKTSAKSAKQQRNYRKEYYSSVGRVTWQDETI